MSKIAFAFGRMNPPTIGHEKLINQLANHHNHMLVLSQTCDEVSNPLTWEDKALLVQTAFPQVDLCLNKKLKTPFQVLEELAVDYDDITFLVGEDRISAFNAMHQYATEWGVKEFSIVSAGDRCPLVEGATGASGTKAREYAMNGQYDLFKTQMPLSMEDKDKHAVYILIRVRYGVCS